MANWQDPRPLFPWSPGVSQQTPAPGPKLRPNMFARMARFSVQNPVAMVLALLFAFAAAATIVLFSLRIDLSQPFAPAASVEATRAANDFALRFGAADRLVRVRLSSAKPNAAAEAARSLSEKLLLRRELFKSVLLPEIEAVDPRFAAYYVDTPDLNRRIDAAISARDYLQLLAAYPTLGGLDGVIATAKGAVDAGSTPYGLAPVLRALANAANQLTKGKPATLSAAEASGFGTPPLLPEVTVLAEPAGSSEQAIASVRDALNSVLIGRPNVVATIESEGRDMTKPQVFSGGRQLVVAVILSLLFLVSLLVVYFRNARDVFLVLLPALFGSIIALAVVALTGATNASNAALPLLLVPEGVFISLCFVLALVRHEKRAISTMSLIMLAAQQSGRTTTAMAAAGLLVWSVWAMLGAQGETVVSVAMLCGVLAAAGSVFVVLPALAAALPRGKPEFVPAAAAAMGRPLGVQGFWLSARPAVSAIIALACVAAVLTFAYQKGLAGGNLATAPLHLQFQERQTAEAKVAALRSEENVGRVLWIEDFLPADAEAKRAALGKLESIRLSSSKSTGTPQALLASQLQQLEKDLQLLATSRGDTNDLKQAALELRRSLELLISEAGGVEQAARSFERVLANGIPAIGPFIENLSKQPPPAVGDLDPALRSLFLAGDGTYRIEAWPRPPVSEEQFAETVRKIDATVISPFLQQRELANELLWRVGLSAVVVVAAMFALAALVLGRVIPAVALALSQIAFALLSGGLAVWLGLWPPYAVALAAVSGLALNAMMALWVLSEQSEQWITPLGFLLSPLAGAAVVLPVVLLSISEVMGFSMALLVLMLSAALIQLAFTPQIQLWISQYAAFASRPAEPDKRNKLELPKFSTNIETSDKTKEET